MVTPEYLAIEVVVLSFFLLLESILDLALWKSWRHQAAFFLVTGVVALSWDSFAIWRGHWTFDPRFLVGVQVGNLPLEEVFFAVIVPYVVLVIHGAVQKFCPGPKEKGR